MLFLFCFLLAISFCGNLGEINGFELEKLPYPKNALEPHVSQETFEYHYEKHHRGYVNKLNGLVEGTALKDKTLEELILTQKGTLFNMAAQVWNHAFYWKSMSPEGGGEPDGKLAKKIRDDFGDFEKFKSEFNKVANGAFGSGWIWLVFNPEISKLVILETHDAGNPMILKVVPLLTLDMWEHSYYIDYRNDRARYLQAWWQVINWEFANENYGKVANDELDEL
jgi:Fe-Mn family superoxide dismutase